MIFLQNVCSKTVVTTAYIKIEPALLAGSMCADVILRVIILPYYN